MMFNESLTQVEDSGDSSPYTDDSSPESPNIPEEPSDWINSKKTLQKTIITEGQGLKCPRQSSDCFVLIKQTAGPSIEELNVEFKLDDSCNIVVGECDSAIGRSIDQVLLTMHEREVCNILCLIKKQELLEAGNVQSSFEIGAATTDCVEFGFTIELQSFQEQPDIHQLEDRLKLERASHHKDLGVKLFQKGLIRASFYRFSKAAKLLIFINNDEHEQKKSLLTACYLNMAACQLKTSMFDHVVQNCSKVLTKDDKNVKAFYRRGVAYLNLKNYEKSVDDLKKVVELDPKNEAAKQKMKIANVERKKLDQYYAKQMSKLFM